MSKKRNDSVVGDWFGGSGYVSHSAELPRVRRICGQMEGIERMIADERKCTDILVQIKAARAALLALESAILKHHLQDSVEDMLASKTSFDAAKKIKELTTLLARQ